MSGNSTTEPTVIDSRPGVNRQYYGGPKLHEDMRVPDELKNSVCFLCAKDEEGFRAFGTAFFLAIPSPLVPDSIELYLVTAKHVLDEARALGYSDFFIRVNTGRGAELIPLPDIWRYPREPESGFARPDVAVMRIDFELDDAAAIAAIPVQIALADKAELESHNVGIGDEVLVIGLFRHRYGYKKNIPIVRGGMLAAMPEESLWDKEDKLYDGYLIEIRSISGLSGSPVIVFKQEQNSTVVRLRPIGKQFADLPIMHTNGYLLGLVRGHWGAENVEAIDAASEREEPLNTGIAIVTPIKNVLDTLALDRLMRNKGGPGKYEVLD